MKRYNAYKPSGIEWSEVIPESWRCCEIAHFTKSMSGGTPDRNKKSYWENGTIPWMSSGEVNKVNIFETDECITELGMQMSSAKMLEENTVVIALNGQGKTKAMSAILRIKSTCNQSLCGFKCDEINLHYAYLFYCFQTMYKYLRSQAGDDSRDGISAYSVTKQRIPVPSFKEQKSISSYLDAKCAKIDNVLSVQQKRIELLKKLKQSIITNAVTKGLDKNAKLKPSGVEWIGNIPEEWKTLKLKHVLSDYQDGTHASYKRVLSDYPLLSAKNVFEEGIKITDDESTISESDFKSIVSNGFPKQGDVAICCVGTIGRCCLYTLAEPQAFQRSVTFLRTNKKILNSYLVYLMRSDVANPQYIMYAKTSAQSGIYMDALVNFKIVLPPKEEQTAIVSYLDKKCSAIDSQISKIERQIELLKEYKQSTITECVTGKRKVC